MKWLFIISDFVCEHSIKKKPACHPDLVWSSSSPDGGDGELWSSSPRCSCSTLSQNTFLVSYNPYPTILWFYKKIFFHVSPRPTKLYHLYLGKCCIEFIWKLFPWSWYFSIFHILNNHQFSKLFGIFVEDKANGILLNIYNHNIS